MPCMKASAIILLIAVFGLSCRNESGYGLPVTIGMSGEQVSKILGEPTERYAVPDKEQQVIRWYYSSGIVGIFNRDHLSRITLNTYSDYQGFLAYSGDVVNHITLNDSKQIILQKLGIPAKIEADELESGTDPNVPVVRPKEARYYWHFNDYLIEATFLLQAQNVSEKQHLTFARDALTDIQITK
jgi:hypothetical protein